MNAFVPLFQIATLFYTSEKYRAAGDMFKRAYNAYTSAGNRTNGGGGTSSTYEAEAMDAMQLSEVCYETAKQKGILS